MLRVDLVNGNSVAKVPDIGIRSCRKVTKNHLFINTVLKLISRKIYGRFGINHNSLGSDRGSTAIASGKFYHISSWLCKSMLHTCRRGTAHSSCTVAKVPMKTIRPFKIIVKLHSKGGTTVTAAAVYNEFGCDGIRIDNNIIRRRVDSAFVLGIKLHCKRIRFNRMECVTERQVVIFYN